MPPNSNPKPFKSLGALCFPATSSRPFSQKMAPARYPCKWSNHSATRSPTEHGNQTLSASNTLLISANVIGSVRQWTGSPTDFQYVHPRTECKLYDRAWPRTGMQSPIGKPLAKCSTLVLGGDSRQLMNPSPGDKCCAPRNWKPMLKIDFCQTQTTPDLTTQNQHQSQQLGSNAQVL